MTKKGLICFVSVWTILLAVFNVIAFVSVGWIGQYKYTPAFWIGYSFISVAFVINLICGIYVFRAATTQKLVYRLAILHRCYAGLILSFIVGGGTMLLSALQYWIAILICVIVLAANLLTVVKTFAASAVAEQEGDAIESKTAFMTEMIAKAQSLMAGVTEKEDKALCKKVYEALRFSDPVSAPGSEEKEAAIRAELARFSSAVDEKDKTAMENAAGVLLRLIAERNSICKAER